MPKKSSTPTRGTKSRTKVKVVTNSKQTKTNSFLRSKWSAFAFVLAFIGIGIGSFAWARAATETFSLWSNGAVPKVITDTDSKSVELGVKFKTKYAGEVTGVRFYKGPQNTGTHTGSLWAKDGRELARVTFTNETAGGWQTASFAEPVAVAANTIYIVSYHAPKGKYSANNDYFNKTYTNGPLTAPKNAGVYKYGNRTAFPTDSYRGSNYWVDVVFSTSRFFPTPKPQAPTELKASASYNAVNLTWKASATADIAKYNVRRDGATIASVESAPTTYTDTNVTAGKKYTYSVQAIDGAGTVSDASNNATVTVPQAAPEPDPEPEPEPTPTPTPTPTPNPGPVSATCPAFPAFPDANCTGYKHSTGFTSDTQLKPKTHPDCQEKDGDEDGHFQRPNAVYDGCVFNFVRIRAPGIVIKNSKIRGTILPAGDKETHHEPLDKEYDYQGLQLIDVEITPFSDAQLDSFCPQQPGWWTKNEMCTTPGTHTVNAGSDGPIGDGKNLTCLRCFIHHGSKSAGGGDNVKYIDTVVSSITFNDPKDHGAGIGYPTGKNIEIIHSNIDCYRWNTRHPQFRQGCSSALSIYNDGGPVDGAIVKNNLFNAAGEYCVYTPNVGRNVSFVDNYFGKRHHAKCGASGPVVWGASQPGNTGWSASGNRWTDGSALNL